ncbi:MAG: acylneuraminate cytidylyltransferase family protein [Dysgonomonas sp.]|nr:acylneuraminate cytidylyltransferase family protein [Dysgonomonas sp.]
MQNKTLFIIPARGGSKGIPYKNIKDFHGKPLIYYSIDLARELVNDEHICISTEDAQIIKKVQDYSLNVPFVRPEELATDTSSTNDVLLHAINHYESKNIFYDKIVLLQPTSPLRKKEHILGANSLYSDTIDMVVSVKISNAGSVLCQENDNGFIESLFNKKGKRRQDIKDLYEYNGAIYIINVKSLKSKGLSNFSNNIKFIMPEINSIDIDTMYDWLLAELLFKYSEPDYYNTDK